MKHQTNLSSFSNSLKPKLFPNQLNFSSPFNPNKNVDRTVKSEIKGKIQFTIDKEIKNIPQLKLDLANLGSQEHNMAKALSDRSKEVEKEKDSRLFKRLSTKQQNLSFLFQDRKIELNNLPNPEKKVKQIVTFKDKIKQQINIEDKGKQNNCLQFDSSIFEEKHTVITPSKPSSFHPKAIKYFKSTKFDMQNQSKISNQEVTQIDSDSHKVSVNDFINMLNKSKMRGKIKQYHSKEETLNFRDSRTSRTVTENLLSEQEKYSYSKIYDQQIMSQQTRSKKNSKVQLWQI